MKYLVYMLIPFLMCCKGSSSAPAKPPSIALVIHGGVGNIDKNKMTETQIASYTAGLTAALEAGYAVLEAGGEAVAAVEAAIVVLENDSLFNAGRGAVYNTLGKQEMDASIMRGDDLNAGAVAGVNRIKNPIRAARAVLEKSKHVMLSGAGAILFAEKIGLELVDSSYFFVQKRYDYWRKVKDREEGISQSVPDEAWESTKLGTVGAVALDRKGNIVAGTSTGGLTNKKYGRIGDSPVIGAGTYANNLTCGISCTGTGELFIRSVAAHEVSSLMQYKGLSVAEATRTVINQRISKLGGEGGMIGLDKAGNAAWAFNTSGMFRGYKKDNETVVKIFKD